MSRQKRDDAVSRVTGILVSDSKNWYDRLNETMLTLKGAEKRSDIESLSLKEPWNPPKFKHGGLEATPILLIF